MSDPNPEVRCGECGASMVIRTSRYGKFWGCSTFPKCKGTHGAHEDGRPLGIPADQETKQARIKAHEAFDALWKSMRKVTRSEAYQWLQHTMGLSKDEAHIGRFTREQCVHLVALLKAKEKP